MKIIYTAKIVGGFFKIINKALFKQDIERFEGKTVEVIIQTKKKRRSSPQNSYYWGVVIPLLREGFKETGTRLTEDETHDLVKMQFLKTSTRGIEYLKSTTSLTTTEFIEYTQQIQEFATEFLGINIPDPNEAIGIEIK